MIGKIRLGYHSIGASDVVGLNEINTSRKGSGLIINRTCRMLDRHHHEIIPQAIQLARQNLDDLEALIEWNETQGYRFFRINSDIFPHITNWRLIRNKLDARCLLYDIEQFRPQLERIGAAARKYGHRLTFHPGFFTILNTSNHFVLISVIRELWWHTRFLEIMGMGADSVLILHIGGVGNNRQAAMRQFIQNYNALPANIKYRIAIENDENNFNIDDILYISGAIDPYEYGEGNNRRRYTAIPICFDYFHYSIWNIYHSRNALKYPRASPVDVVLPKIRASWQHGRRQKMHLSEQLDYGPLGMHSYLLDKCGIPKPLRDLDIDLMIEARGGEYALFALEKKYG